MYFNFWLRNRQNLLLATQTGLLALFAFILIDFKNSVDAQSTRRTSPSNGQTYRRTSTVTAAETKVRAAYLQSMANANVKFDDHKAVFDWLTESSGKEKWRKIQWRHDLWDARIESAKTGKPIFIWAMNGDPLGCV